MWKALGDLWNGRIPLAQAFWRYAVLYGIAVNIAAIGSVFAALAAGAGTAVVLVLYFLPAPYWFVASLGVWRSADRYQGPQRWANAARAAAVAWFLVMLIV